MEEPELSYFYDIICDSVKERSQNITEVDEGRLFYFGDLGLILGNANDGIVISFKIPIESTSSKSFESLLEIKVQDFIETGLFYKSGYFLDEILVGKKTNMKEIYKVFKEPKQHQQKPGILLFPVKRIKITEQEAELFMPYAIIPISLLHHKEEETIEKIRRTVPAETFRRLVYRQSS